MNERNASFQLFLLFALFSRLENCDRLNFIKITHVTLFLFKIGQIFISSFPPGEAGAGGAGLLQLVLPGTHQHHQHPLPELQQRRVQLHPPPLRPVRTHPPIQHGRPPPLPQVICQCPQVPLESEEEARGQERRRLPPAEGAEQRGRPEVAGEGQAEDPRDGGQGEDPRQGERAPAEEGGVAAGRAGGAALPLLVGGRAARAHPPGASQAPGQLPGPARCQQLLGSSLGYSVTTVSWQKGQRGQRPVGISEWEESDNSRVSTGPHVLSGAEQTLQLNTRRRR